MNKRIIYITILGFFVLFQMKGQTNSPIDMAEELAHEGKYKEAVALLLKQGCETTECNGLMARMYSWQGNYSEARIYFNRATSKDKDDHALWLATIKNELYAKEYYLALGLANKAKNYIGQSKMLDQLKIMAEQGIADKVYTNSPVISEKVEKPKTSKTEAKELLEERYMKRGLHLNRVGLTNTYTTFSERYDPIFNSSVSYTKRTALGTIIPKINYSARSGLEGIQYELDLYPTFGKGKYAYLNYGYSNASFFPNHKIAGDFYFNFAKAFEFSAGGRFIISKTSKVAAITNSIGHYRGNYYFSLRSYVNPRPDNLSRVSMGLLVRKYGKDAQNYWGLNLGLGYSPELQQQLVANQLVAETLFYIESQRVGIEYQFGTKNNEHIYKFRLSFRRQELSFDSGNFFYAITGGLNYNFNF